jgi:hypothetical protein
MIGEFSSLINAPGCADPELATDRLNGVVCTRVRELQEAISAGTIAVEISSRKA